MQSSKQKKLSLPKNFLFGVATAAYQIEGAANEDGRASSIWDDFSRAGGNVVNDDNGDIACNHYHLWQSDLDLIKSLGVDAYRFSFAWPRIIPHGTGKPNEKGLAFYDKLIDGCLERGLDTFATLYHWDLPSALQAKGGWAQRDTALAFADYAQLVTERFGDRLSTISTFNEPWCSSILSNLHGVHAPGKTDLSITIKCIHNQHLAHGLAVQRIRSINPKLPTGIVLNLQSIYPATESVDDKAASLRHEVFHNGSFIEPLFQGRYPKEFVEHLSQHLPNHWQDDLKHIHQPLDFWGLNYYTPIRVLNDSSDTAHYPKSIDAPLPNGCEKTDIGWEVDADSFKDLMIKMYKHYDLPPLYITENGACINDEPVDGIVNDERRVSYLDQHLNALSDAYDSGVPVKGYFAWSLMDNFEWAEGYTMRFGLVHVDYKTQIRTVKQSGRWFSELIDAQRQ